MHYWCHLHCCVQHALYFKLFKFVFPYFSRLFFFNTLSAGIDVSIKSASMFSLKANRGSVCYNLLVAEHGFVATGCGTHLYHLSIAIFTVTSLETLRRPYHYVYVVSSNCSHICSFQYLCRVTFGIQCFISNSNHPLSRSLLNAVLWKPRKCVTLFNEPSTLISVVMPTHYLSAPHTLCFFGFHWPSVLFPAFMSKCLILLLYSNCGYLTTCNTANGCSLDWGINFLWKTKVHHHVQNSSPLDVIFSQVIRVHNIVPFVKFDCDIQFPPIYAQHIGLFKCSNRGGGGGGGSSSSSSSSSMAVVVLAIGLIVVATAAVYKYIQSVPRVRVTTSGECSLC